MPLEQAAADKVWRIVLVGPHAAARRALFRRLVEGPAASAAAIGKPTSSFVRGSFDLGGIAIDLVDLPEDATGEEYGEFLERGNYALCVDPYGEQSQERIAPFLNRFRPDDWYSHCVVLVSQTQHLTDHVEERWEAYLERQGVDSQVFRVNCSDRMSPELFVKLFLAGVIDRGERDDGIEVSGI